MSSSTRFKRCGHGPGELHPDDQVVVDAFRSMLAALKQPEPWQPGTATDVAVRLGALVERGHPRPGDDTGPVIALALVHPDDGNPLGRGGWLTCEREQILGAWDPAYRMLTHIGSNVPLPENPLPPAHYAVHITRPGHAEPMKIGPFHEAHVTSTVAWQLRSLLPHAAVDTALFSVNRNNEYTSPEDLPDLLDLLLAVLASADGTHSIPDLPLPALD
jgi:hypothetical protein